jgi:photosystem II stability/assembly factor-like uncharacterized protein
MSTPETEVDPIYAVAASESVNGTPIWYAARQSGLYVSTDRGATWTDSYTSLALEDRLTTASVALSPTFRHDSTLFTGSLGGILASSDGGATWSVSELPPPPPFVVSLVVSPNYSEDGLVFAGTLEDGVFRSWDRGSSWASWNFGLLDLNVYCLAASPNFADDDTLFAGAESGVFRSTNGGRAWRETSFPMDSGPVLSLAVSPSYGADGTLLAGTELHGVYRSEDRGETWQAAGLRESPQAVDQLLACPTENEEAKCVAVTRSAVLLSQFHAPAWRTVWQADGPGNEDISAAALSIVDSTQELILGMGDGSILSINLPLESN